MSCNLWAYVPHICDGDYCCGDCDECEKVLTGELEEGDEDERRSHIVRLEVVAAGGSSWEDDESRHQCYQCVDGAYLKCRSADAGLRFKVRGVSAKAT